MATATTTPQTSMETELYYSTAESGTELKQIFQVQEIPTLVSAQDPVTYSNLESQEEYAAKGTRKYESIAIPILYVEAQHDELKALETADTSVWFFVKLPDSTAETTDKPLTFKFKGKLSLSNDTISIDGMLQETITIFRESTVTELKGLPASA